MWDEKLILAKTEDCWLCQWFRSRRQHWSNISSRLGSAVPSLSHCGAEISEVSHQSGSAPSAAASLKLRSRRQQLVTMPGLIKRLSKSAGDLSPCRKKSRSNSDEEFQLEEREVSLQQSRYIQINSNMYKTFYGRVKEGSFTSLMDSAF